MVEGRQSREEATQRYASFHDTHEWKFRCMLLVQKALPLVPPRLLALVVRVVGIRPFVNWSFGRYLAIAPAEMARLSAGNQHLAEEEQHDADQPLRSRHFALFRRGRAARPRVKP